MKSWYDNIKSYTISAAANTIGMQINKNRAGPCPACGEKTSGKNDSRKPVKILGADTIWLCNACHFKGNIFDLISFHMHGCKAGDLEEFSVLREFISYEPMMRSYEPEPVEEPKYPPFEEIKRFVLSSTPVAACTDAKINRWLLQRGLDKSKIPAVIIDPLHEPGWMTEVTTSRGNPSPWWPRPWRTQYPILIPLFDYKANLRSVVGRTTMTKRRKSTVPIGYTTRNLFNATKAARKFMQNIDIPEKIWITEGEMDYLTIAQYGEAAIGIRSGSIQDIGLLRWKNHQTVYIATDNDQAGDRYAEQVAETVYPAKPARIMLDALGRTR